MTLTGDELVRVLAALSNPHRLRVIAALAGGPNYVSQLARDLEISRPLLQVHLKRLEAAGLIESEFRLSDDGKAMKFYSIRGFRIDLSPATIGAAAASLTDVSEREGGET